MSGELKVKKSGSFSKFTIPVDTTPIMVNGKKESNSSERAVAKRSIYLSDRVKKGSENSPNLIVAPDLPKVFNEVKYHALPMLAQSPKKVEEMPQKYTVIDQNSRLRATPPGTPHFAIQPPRQIIPEVNIRPQLSIPSSPAQHRSTTSTEPARPNYNSMSASQQADKRNMFKFKFGTLRMNYPNWNIQDPSDDTSLDQIHDLYENYVKQIMISLNSSDWRKYLVGLFLGMEIIGIKIFKLDIAGYTMAQLKSINNYDRLLIEIGEKYYFQSESNWPIEAKFMFVAIKSFLMFCGFKFLSKYVGGAEMFEFIQSLFDGANNVNFDKSPAKQLDEVGIPIPVTKPDGGGLMNMLGSFMGGQDGGNGGGVTELIAKIGNAFTQNLASNNQPAEPAQPVRRRVIFSD